MDMRRIAASVTIALAIAVSVSGVSFGHPERAAAARETVILPPYNEAHSHLGRDEAVFSEDFENNAEGWTTTDWTIPVTAFHKSDYMSDDHNNHWWCGDTITGYAAPFYGYDNMWLQYLDTPVLDLSGASDQVALTFRSRWLLEDPRLVDPPEPWDGWDGWMVLVSTDRGANFEVMQPESPAYTAQHISSAERFWMLEGDWPGWVFESKAGGRDAWDAEGDTMPEPEWVNCTFNLSGYRQDGVVVRFMMVSDRTVSAVFSAEGQANRYLANSGVLIDDVLIQDRQNVILSNNADDDPVPSDLIPRHGEGFGDTWGLTRADVHTGTYAIWNDDDNFNVINSLDSPSFHIPADGNTHLEYWVHADLPDAVHPNSSQPNVLRDFYQLYVSNDDGATWTYFTHDWNRAEAGLNGWVHYLPGVPITGNTELSFSDYVDQDVRVRWMFWADNDNTEGNGTGLFIDDVDVVHENQMNRDAGFQNLYVGYPLQAGVRKVGVTANLINYGLTNLNPIYCYFGWENEDLLDQELQRPYSSVPANDTASLTLSDYVDRAVRGWTPPIAGTYSIFARTAVGSQTTQDPSDDDQKPENDTSFMHNVVVWPADIAELGYDSRSVRFAYPFDQGSGPAVRFTPPAGMEDYSIAFANFQFNGGQEGDATFRLHILQEGDNDNSVGAEITALDVDVTPEECYPNTKMVSLSEFAITPQSGKDFWVWVELLRDDNRPQIVGDALNKGTGRMFNITNGNAAAFNGDLMIHAGVIPAANTAPNLVGVQEFFDFGEVIPDDILTKYYTLYSTGLNPVTITSVSIREQSYSVEWPGEMTLKTGESIRFAITFSPADGNVHADTLTIVSSDQTPPVITVAGSGAMGVADSDPIQPITFGLSAPYPNPFNSLSRFNFRLEKAGFAAVTLHDLSGREVAKVTSGVFEVGNHTAMVNAIDLPTGLYLLKLESNNQTAIQKIALIR